MADQQLPAEQVDRIRDSYAFDEPAIDLGVLDNGGEPVTALPEPSTEVSLGLIAATLALVAVTSLIHARRRA